ncbi:MAG: hypothetical protein KDK70_30770 [Myxococcales bacterium]|nr:hypothetical protein [Myxococcales bacterium]
MFEGIDHLPSRLHRWIAVSLLAAVTLPASACDDTLDDDDALPLELRSATPGASSIDALGPGDGETWAVLPDGSLKGWGQRYCTTAGGCPAPAAIAPVVLPGPAVDVRSNGQVAMALMADGTVLSLGSTVADTLAPQPVSWPDAVTELALGADFVCGRLDDGTVPCQALDGVPAPAWLAGYEPVGNAVEVVAGSHHACARTTGQSVVCWGDNAVGQLGSTAAAGLTPIPLSDAAQQLAAGAGHTCALLSDATVECWGDDAEGQRGHDQPGVGSVTPLGPITQITAGAEHTCALGSNRAHLYCWGSNALGQLGISAEVTGGIHRVDLGGLLAVEVMAGPTAWTTFALFEGAGLRGWGHDDVHQTGYGDLFDGKPQSAHMVGNLPDILVLDVSEE